MNNLCGNPNRANWRFRVSDGETVSFEDGTFGHQEFRAGKDFGDFVAWRHDDRPFVSIGRRAG